MPLYKELDNIIKLNLQSTQKQITVETCAPVCSKTKTHLWNHRVLITTTNQNTTNEK